MHINYTAFVGIFVGHSTKRSGKFMYRSADGAEYGNFPTGKRTIRLCNRN